MRPFLLMACLLAGFQCLAQPLPAWQGSEGLQHSRLGQALDISNGQWLDAQALVRRVAEADRLLVGERHDNPDHQALQFWLLQALHERRMQQALLLEMLTPAQQPALRQLDASAAQRTDLDELLDWSPGWNWQAYAPLLRWGLQQGVGLYPANIDRALIGQLYREPPPLLPVYADEALDGLRATIAASHCRELPPKQVEAMLAIQQARDQAMAAALLTAPVPAMLVAGSFHVRHDLGVPLYWPEDQPRPLVIVLLEAGEALPNSFPADFVWITPAQPEQDYCAGMAEAD